MSDERCWMCNNLFTKERGIGGMKAETHKGGQSGLICIYCTTKPYTIRKRTTYSRPCFTETPEIKQARQIRRINIEVVQKLYNAWWDDQGIQKLFPHFYDFKEFIKRHDYRIPKNHKGHFTRAMADIKRHKENLIERGIDWK